MIDREHDGVIRRTDVETDHVSQLGGEGRVGGQLELTDPVRLQTVSTPMRWTER